MPYVWFEGLKLYCDYDTEYEKRMKEYRREWQRAKRKGEKYSKKKKKREKKPIKYDNKQICACGGGWSYTTNKMRHLESNKHKKYIKELNFQKNLKPELDEFEI